MVMGSDDGLKSGKLVLPGRAPGEASQNSIWSQWKAQVLPILGCAPRVTVVTWLHGGLSQVQVPASGLSGLSTASSASSRNDGRMHRKRVGLPVTG
jgi:hypothetical protein